MPFRAFDDSDGDKAMPEIVFLKGESVLMPFRAFDDSDASVIRGALETATQVLMPFRAFDDSDPVGRLSLTSTPVRS